MSNCRNEQSYFPTVLVGNWNRTERGKREKQRMNKRAGMVRACGDRQLGLKQKKLIKGQRRKENEFFSSLFFRKVHIHDLWLLEFLLHSSTACLDQSTVKVVVLNCELPALPAPSCFPAAVLPSCAWRNTREKQSSEENVRARGPDEIAAHQEQRTILTRNRDRDAN